MICADLLVRKPYPLIPEVEEKLNLLFKKQQEEKEICGNCYIESPYIFKWENGKPFTPDFIYKHFKRLLAKNNLPDVRFHDLRHTCASILLEKGWSLKHIQEWLRHADIETTGNIYAHLNKEKAIPMATDLSDLFDVNRD